MNLKLGKCIGKNRGGLGNGYDVLLYYGNSKNNKIFYFIPG